jgi:hypothetical protein
MSLFFRVIRHLLPDAIAWRLREAGTRFIDRFFEGLADAFASARTFSDEAYLDLFPESARTPALLLHEHEHGLLQASDESARRANIAAAWSATGGQSPSNLQAVVQAAGFDLYIHEWWASGPPWVARDPRDHTTHALVGTTQCGEPLALCGESQARCNNFLQNNPGYLVNETLARRAPPPVPADPAMWPYFIYWGAETFPNRAEVPANRRAELEALLLQLCPMDWLVLLVDYIGEGGGGGAYVLMDPSSGEVSLFR